MAAALISSATIVCQWLAWRMRLPSILLLLGTGIILGPLTGLLNPSETFQDLLLPFVSLAVAVILFEGSLTLRLPEIREHGNTVRNMVSMGFFATWLITALAAHFIIGLDWSIAFLFGAIMIVTGPTVVIPMLRSIRPNDKIANILRWEGILIDPIGALFALLVYDVIVANQIQSAIGGVVQVLVTMVVVGFGVGVAAGYLLGKALEKYWVPKFLHNVTTLLTVFVAYTCSDFLQHESGLLSVTVMGIWLANVPKIDVKEILDFKESLSILLISSLFLLLAAELDINLVQQLGLGAVLVFLVVQFIARPVKIILSSYGSSLTVPEKALLSWIAPRGIVAAAISAVFALKLEAQGFEQANLLVPLTFSMIIGTVVWQSLTAAPLARWLGVAQERPNGVFIVGGNAVARTIAKGLKDAGFKVLVADNSWPNTQEARMAGLETYFGNPLSEHASMRINLYGFGKLLVVSPRPEFNQLACVHFKDDFRSNAVFSVKTSSDEFGPRKTDASAPYRGQALFGEKNTYAKLASLISQGATIKRTGITEDFDYQAYLEQNSKSLTPLFAWDSTQRLYVFGQIETFQPKPGWTIMGLTHPN